MLTLSISQRDDNPNPTTIEPGDVLRMIDGAAVLRIRAMAADGVHWRDQAAWLRMLGKDVDKHEGDAIALLGILRRVEGGAR